jgi:hypothetical protein
MNKKIIAISSIGVAIIIVGGITLTGSFKLIKNNNPKESPTATHAPTPVVPTTQPTSSRIEFVGSLPLPLLSSPLTPISGDGLSEFGNAYVQSAYKFSVAFANRINTMSFLWDSKKSPNVKFLLPIGDYLVNSAQSTWYRYAPFMVEGKTSELNDFYNRLLFIPYRKSDGTIDYNAGLVLTSPWVTGASVQPIGATVVNDSELGRRALSIHFKINFIVKALNSKGEPFGSDIQGNSP